MRSFSPTLLVVFLFTSWISPEVVHADDVTLSGVVAFQSLDGSPDDHDGVANGVFTVDDGNLVIAGTIQCNDGPPLPGNASACPIAIVVSGNLTIEAGGALLAENQQGSGSGGAITLTVGGNLVLQGPASGLPGAVISSSRISGGSSGGGNKAGKVRLSAGGSIDVEAGSVVAANALDGLAGVVEIAGQEAVSISGLVSSGPSRTVLATALTGKVLSGDASGQVGGPITVTSASRTEPSITVGTGGIVVSQGETNGADRVTLAGCGIEVRGLVASVSKRSGPSEVSLLSGKDILVDGRDLGVAGPSAGRRGRLRADATLESAQGYRIDLFASGTIEVHGPDPASSGLFAASSNPGSQSKSSGGTIRAISLGSTITASGNAFEAGRSQSGNKGGNISLAAQGDVGLDGATLKAVGDLAAGKGAKGGAISVRSYQAAVSWTFGVGDVRPVGTGIGASGQGSIVLTACTGIDITGSQFPVLGSAIPPFPVESDGVCAPAAPSLPAGTLLPQCNAAPVADEQAVETDEDTEVTITLTGSDADGEPLTFTIDTAPAHGSLGPLTSPTATSAEVVYTPDLDYNGPDSFIFKVDDGNGGTDTATVTITVRPVDDTPVARDDAFTVAEGGTLDEAAPGVLDNDTDGESSPLTAVLVAGPSHASSFALNADGSFNYTHDGSETPSTDSFTYHANDGTSDSNVATVTITITAVNDAPIANDDAFTVAEGGTLGQAAPGVLGNDTDGESSPLTAVLLAGPSHAASFTLNANGSFSYTHDGSETPLSDSFTYRANDGTSDSNTATVTITITAVDDPPTAIDDAATVDEDSGANVIDVLANDTDLDGGPKAIQLATDPANGVVVVAGDGLSLSYAPDANYCNNPGGMPDTFSYTLTPGGDTATVSVTVVCINDPPTADADRFDYVGNTELRVDPEEDASTPHVLETTPTTFGVVDGDSDPEGDAITVSAIEVGACTDASAPLECTDPTVGTVRMEPNGRFSFEPVPGDTGVAFAPGECPEGATDKEIFQYIVTDDSEPAASTTAVVTLCRFGRVWYVNNDTGTADGAGTSVDPFGILADVQAPSSADDYIFVHFGTGTSAGMDAGLSLKSGQHLIGEHVGLALPFDLNGNGAPTELVEAAEPDEDLRPVIDDTVAGGPEGVSAIDVVPAEIVGLSLAGDIKAIEWTTTAAFSGSGNMSIRDNVIRGAGGDGVDINLAGTGAPTLAFHDNTLTATGTALDIQETGAGSLTITAFHNNTVTAATGGTGINVLNALFDAVPGVGVNRVYGGNTMIGVPGNGVGGAGLVLSNVTGDLAFGDAVIAGDLDVYSGAAALVASSTLVGGIPQFRLTVTPSVPDGSTLVSTGGPAADINSVTADLRLSSLISSNSTTRGVALTNLRPGSPAATFPAHFSAPSGSISTSSDSATAFFVDQSNATISYGGTINTADGTGVMLTSNTGSTISFSGALTLSTGEDPAFAATGGGTVTSTNSASTLTTTTATALNVASTTIGSSGLTFRSISANGASNGITLSSTGTSGGLTVTGSGSAGTGGTIQNITNRGASFIDAVDIELNWMNFTNAATANGADPTSASSGCGDLNVGGNLSCNAPIHLVNVTGLAGGPGAKLDRLTITNSAQVGINLNNVTELELTNTTLTGIGNQVREYGIKGRNVKGDVTISGLSVTGSFGENFRVENNDGSTVVTVTGSTFGSSTQGGGFFHVAQDDAQTDVDISTSTFSSNFTTGLLVGVNDPGASGSVNLDVNGGTFNNNNAGIQVIGAGGADVTFDILNVANISGNPASGLALDLADNSTAAGSLIGTILGNTVTQPASGAGNGIGVTARGAGTTTVAVTNNTVTNRTQYGIFLHRKEGLSPGTLNATVSGNTVTTIDVAADTLFPIDGIRVEAGAATADTGTVCAHISGNTADGTNTQPDAPGDDIRLRHRFAHTFRLPGMAGTTATDAINHLNSQNPAADLINATTTTSFTGGAACPTP